MAVPCAHPALFRTGTLCDICHTFCTKSRFFLCEISAWRMCVHARHKRPSIQHSEEQRTKQTKNELIPHSHETFFRSIDAIECRVLAAEGACPAPTNAVAAFLWRGRACPSRSELTRTNVSHAEFRRQLILPPMLQRHRESRVLRGSFPLPCFKVSSLD